MDEHQEFSIRDVTMKWGMVDPVWKQKDGCQPMWNEVKIQDQEECWIIRYLKELAHLLGQDVFLSRLSIDINTVWKLLRALYTRYISN